MPNVRPNERPRWATDGAALVSPLPSVSKRLAGWFADESPAGEFLNWMMRSYGKWIDHVGSNTSTYDSLLAATDPTGEFPLVVGDTCFINEAYDPSLSAGAPIVGFDPETVAAKSRTIHSVATDGAHVYIIACDFSTPAATSFLRRIVRSTGAIDGTWSALPGATAPAAPLGYSWDLQTDGVYIALASHIRVEVFNAVTGATVWATVPANSAARRCAMDTERLYVTEGDNVTAYTISDGTLEWTFDHGAPVTGVATDGLFVYIMGERSAHASGADLRRLVASSGASETTEGGTAATGAATGGGWDRQLAVLPAAAGDLKLGPNGMVFISYTNSSNYYVSRRQSQDGKEEWLKQVDGFAQSGVIGLRLGVDQDFIWGPLTVEGFIAPITHDGRTFGHAVPITSGPARLYSPAVTVSDGSYLWTAGSVVDSGPTLVGGLFKSSRGSKIRHWRRINPATTFCLPLQQLIVPA